MKNSRCLRRKKQGAVVWGEIKRANEWQKNIRCLKRCKLLAGETNKMGGQYWKSYRRILPELSSE